MPYREEDSETIRAGRGYRNIEGPKSKRAGLPLTKYYPFEKTLYPSLQEAQGSAIERMLLQDRDTKYKRYEQPFERLNADTNKNPRP